MNMKKILALALCLVLVAGLSIGGTIAWITASTQKITNTFTVGDINIALTETTTNYKMVPGSDIAKNPKVSVEAGSEDCYLFVKIEESDNLDSYISYAIAQGWTTLESTDKTAVIYRVVAANDDPREFSVLADDKVTVLGDVTKAMLDSIDENPNTAPTLAFKAFAVQKANVADAATAWSYVPANEK